MLFQLLKAGVSQARRGYMRAARIAVPASDTRSAFQLPANYAAVPFAVNGFLMRFTRGHSLYLIGAQG